MVPVWVCNACTAVTVGHVCSVYLVALNVSGNLIGVAIGLITEFVIIFFYFENRNIRYL